VRFSAEEAFNHPWI
jgi:calcium-dependent protein kinase